MSTNIDHSLIAPGTVIQCADSGMIKHFRPATRDEIAMLRPGNPFWLPIKRPSGNGIQAFIKWNVMQLRCEKINYPGGHIVDERGVFFVDNETLLRTP